MPFSVNSGAFVLGVGHVWPKSETFRVDICDVVVDIFDTVVDEEIDFIDDRDSDFFDGLGSVPEHFDVAGFLSFLFASESDVADWPSTTSLASDFDCDDVITLVDSVVKTRVDDVVPFDADEVTPFTGDAAIKLAADDVMSLVETSVVFAVDTESKLLSSSLI